MLTLEEKQTLFDRGIGGIIDQGGPSMDQDGEDCVYRDGSGRKCAIGHLIGDEHYKPSFEGAAMFNKNEKTRSIIRAVSKTTGISEGVLWEEADEFLEALQQLHDTNARGFSMSDFISRAQVFAKIHELNTDILEPSSSK